MNPQMKALAPIGIAALVLGAYAFTFTVSQWEMAIKLRLGEIVATDYEPGLHFKIPGLNSILTFDRRIQTLDARPQRFLTLEKKDVIVDSYAKWRISNAAQYFRSTGGNAARTAQLLADRINTSLRNEFGKRTIQEVISEDRQEIMTELTKAIDTQADDLGVEVVDVRIKKIDLPPEVSESVYSRMRAERERVARDLRAKGGEAAERIQADADRQRTVILAEAYKLSEQARGEGDAKATEVYATAYSKDADFFAFYRSLNAYREAFGDGTDMMVLQPDSEFLRFFKTKSPTETAPLPPSGDTPSAKAAPLPPSGDTPSAKAAPLPPSGDTPSAKAAPLPPSGGTPSAKAAPLPPSGGTPSAEEAPLPPGGGAPPS